MAIGFFILNPSLTRRYIYEIYIYIHTHIYREREVGGGREGERSSRNSYFLNSFYL